MRYSLDDSQLRGTGWCNLASFDEELPTIVRHYKETFVW